MQKINIKGRLVFLLISFMLFFVLLYSKGFFTDSFKSSVYNRYFYLTNNDYQTSKLCVSKGDAVKQPIHFNYDTNTVEVKLPSALINSIDKFVLASKDNDFSYDLSVDTINSSSEWIRLTGSSMISKGDYLLSFIINENCELSLSSSMDKDKNINLNNLPYNKCLSVRIIVPSDIPYIYIAISIILLIFTICVLFLHDFSVRSFVVLALGFGLLIVILNPFPGSENEYNSYLSILSFNNKQYLSDANMYASWFKSGSLNTTSILDNYNNNSGASYTQYLFSLIPFKLNFTGLFSFIYFNAVQYLRLDSNITIILTRLLLLLTYIVVCSYSLYRCKRIKHILFVFASSPILLFKASSINTDALTVSFVFLFISICMHYHDQKIESNLSVNDFLSLLLSSVFIASYNYLLLFPILFIAYSIINRNSFHNKIRIIAFSISLFAIICLQFVMFVLNVHQLNNYIGFMSENFALSSNSGPILLKDYLFGIVHDFALSIGRIYMPLSSNIITISFGMVLFFILMFITLLSSDNELLYQGNQTSLVSYCVVLFMVQFVYSIITFLLGINRSIRLFNESAILIILFLLLLSIIPRLLLKNRHNISNIIPSVSAWCLALLSLMICFKLL